MRVKVLYDKDNIVFDFSRERTSIVPSSNSERDMVLQTLRGAVAYLEGLGNLESSVKKLHFESVEVDILNSPEKFINLTITSEDATSEDRSTKIWRVYPNGEIKDESHVLWRHFADGRKCAGYDGDVDEWSKHNMSWRGGCAQVVKRKGEEPTILYEGMVDPLRLKEIIKTIDTK